MEIQIEPMILLALQRQQSGIEVNDLVFFVSYPPHAYNAVTTAEARFLEAFSLIVPILFGTGSTSDSLGPKYRPCRDIGPVIRLMRQDGLLPHFVDEATALRFSHTWVSNHQALRNYQPAGKFPGNLMVRAREQEPPDVMELLAMRSVSKEEGADDVDGKIPIIDVPGDHSTMFSNRLHVKSRGDEFARWLGSHPLFSTSHQHKLCHA